MKAIILILSFFLTGFSFTQTNAHLPLKSYFFNLVTVNERQDGDSLFHETGQFFGLGEIYIYTDSITVSWSNEWECGTYRLFVDTAVYYHEDFSDKDEWRSSYKVRSKGYHRVDGYFVLIEGTAIERGRYTDILFDTNIFPDGWAMRRRVYSNVQTID